MVRFLSAKRLLQLLFVPGLLLLAGCIAPQKWVWQHPQGLGQAELQQATADCRQIARDEVNRYDYFVPDYPPFWNSYHYRRYYDYYYYSPLYYYDYQRRYDDEQRFFRTCMHAKGWQLVPVPRPH